ncbi:MULTISPECIES: glycosyltransferase [Proteus]|uniref:WemC n=4 Tax=Proteus mirabilis TaxID=584 RepID=D9YYZ2_PROMI|nr:MULTISPECIES: glycosyltransferase [Proteus]ADL32279.1 WemC [Proteus mirabilis]EEI50019.1 glycosyltransferase, group 1 family protein [Proteus mirabilis ATCC 29906]EKU3802856.1 glycosyltransferase [Proteus mirabilis]ELA7712540.1 glycosyltransferase [Proteus mirabilis]ELA7950440.1 glycosyltransferase [Proteus mirabilis]
MNILILLPSLGGGGAEKNAVLIANQLAKKNNVHIVIIYNEITNENRKRLDNNVSLTLLNKKKIIFSMWKIRNIILKENYDVILTTVAYFGITFSFLLPFINRKKKIYIYRETNIPSIYNKNFNILKRIIFKLGYLYTMKNYDYIICQSNDMINDLNIYSSIPSRKIIKINNPITRPECHPSIINNKKSENYVFAAGRLTQQKGFLDLIKNYSTSNALKKNIKLYIAGMGPQYNEMKILINSLNLNANIILLGFKDDLSSYLLNAKAFILSSNYEGFPNIVLEALSYGCPVLSNDCPGGINEIIIPNFNGLIYSKNNFNEMLDLILKIDFDRNQISEDIIKRYDANLLLSKYDEIIDNDSNINFNHNK